MFSVIRAVVVLCLQKHLTYLDIWLNSFVFVVALVTVHTPPCVPHYTTTLYALFTTGLKNCLIELETNFGFTPTAGSGVAMIGGDCENESSRI